MPKTLAAWVIGALVVVCGLAALFIASRAESTLMYYTGVLFFIGCVLFIFSLIKRHYDESTH